MKSGSEELRVICARTRPEAGNQGTIDTMISHLRRLVALCAAACIVGALACAGEEGVVPARGKVTDARGGAVSGARVRSYEVVYDGGVYSLAITGEATTASDGSFSLRATPQSPGHVSAGVFASKDGLALDWADWDYGDHPFSLVLGDALTLGGKVVDVAGKPIGGAQVSAFLAIGDMPRPRWLPGLSSLDALTVKTDSDGAFLFKNLPTGATADFIASAPGKARTFTSTWKTRFDMRGGFPAGKTDIEIALPAEARIEGVVTEKGSGRGVSGQRMVCRLRKTGIGYESVEVTTQEGGAFAFDSLAAGGYVVEPLAKGSDETKLTAAPAIVSVETGQTTGGVAIAIAPEVEAAVKVVDAADGTPLAQAGVEIAEPQTAAGETGDDGLVRFTLPQGRYTVAKVYKIGYRTAELDATFDVESTQSVLVLKLDSLPAIRGVARDEAGSPVAGATVWIIPVGVDAELATDDSGAFKGQWEPDNWGTPRPQIFVILRNEDKDLAAAVEVANPDTPVQAVMKKGADLTVHLVGSDGKPVEGAPVTANILVGSNMLTIGQTASFTDADGRWTWKALPVGFDYTLEAVAPQFGRRRSTVTLSGSAAAKATVVEMRLSAANLTVSGTVVDSDGGSVEKATITVSGEGQPSRAASSDSQGKFRIEGISEGDITLTAYKKDKNLYGTQAAKAGAQDVRITVNAVAAGSQAAQIASLVGKPLPDAKDFGIDAAVDGAVDKMVLICFFDLNQRASRRVVSELEKISAGADKRGMSVIGVDTSGIDADARRAALEKAGAKFPVGSLPADGDKTLKKWGVQAQPWLILAGRTHDVKAEGFNIEQLDDAIAGKVTAPKAVGPPPGPTWY